MNNTKPVHAPQTQFKLDGDCLLIGGIPVTRLAQRVGSTPFYAYDRRALTERAKSLRTALPPEIALHYSVKANPMPALVQHMAGLVDGMDVASGGELSIALDTPLAPRQISYAGPGKTEGELERAISAGVIIHVESERQLEAANTSGQKLGIRPEVMIRVNPGFELKSSGMKMGGGPRQFGIDAEEVPRVLTRVAQLDIGFHGFHIFSGSQNLRAEAIIEEKSLAIELAIRLSEHARNPIRSLNIGGGFGIPYFPGEAPLDIAPIGDFLARRMARLGSELPEAKVILELGRYLVGEAGVYITRIIDRKVSRGQVFLITDGGMNHHLAASGNLGQVIRKNYPVAIANRMTGTTREIVSVAGPLCTPLDLLAYRMEMAQADTGDLVVVFQSGAYGLSASPGGFLSHPRPAEVLL